MIVLREWFQFESSVHDRILIWQVSEGGTRSLLCYLQTLGEQHRLMNLHMDRLVYSDAAPDKMDSTRADVDDDQSVVRNTC
jgi:hypothetical protein